MLSNDNAGQRESEIGNEVTFATIDEGIDQLGARALEARLHSLDHRWRERPIDQASVTTVLRWVGALQGLHMPPTHFVEVLVVHPAKIGSTLACQLLDEDVVGVRLGIGQDVLEVLVVGDQIEAGLWHAVHRRLLAHLPVVGKRAGLNGRIQQASLDVWHAASFPR